LDVQESWYMLGGEDPVRGDAGAAKVLRLLDALRESEAGRLIYGQVERMLSEVADRQVAMEQAYLGVTQALLDAYAQHLPTGPARRYSSSSCRPACSHP
jgi:diguanylate cyclase